MVLLISLLALLIAQGDKRRRRAPPRPWSNNLALLIQSPHVISYSQSIFDTIIVYKIMIEYLSLKLLIELIFCSNIVELSSLSFYEFDKIAKMGLSVFSTGAGLKVKGELGAISGSRVRCRSNLANSISLQKSLL